MGTEASEVLRRHDLMERYQVSRMTVWRWESAGHLPKPDLIIAGKPGWYAGTILEFERRSAGHGA